MVGLKILVLYFCLSEIHCCHYKSIRAIRMLLELVDSMLIGWCRLLTQASRTAGALFDGNEEVR